MRIAVVGLGGVGAYIGSKLCALKDEHEIIFLARGEHLKQIQEHGLKLIDVDEERISHPSAVLENTSKHLDIIFLCTKSYQSKEALVKLGSAISKETLIIPISNGVNNAQMLRPLTPARVVDACVYIVSHLLSPGIVKKSTNIFALILSEELQELLEPLLSRAELRCKFAVDIKKELWKKYLFISAMGSLTSYYSIGMGTVYKEHKEELVLLLNEIFSVAKAENISIEAKEIDKVLNTASKLPLDAPTSLWLDMQAGKSNELETLSLYVITTASAHDISVPVMQKLYDKLSQNLAVDKR